MSDTPSGIAIPRTTKFVAADERDADYLVQTVKDGGYGNTLNTSITVGTDPTGLPTTPMDGRKWVSIYNASGVDLYVGDEDVAATAGGGQVIASHGTRVFPFNAPLYGVVASGTAVVSVLEAS